MTDTNMIAEDHGLTPDSFPGTSSLNQEAIDAAVESIRRLADWHVWPERDETLTFDAPGDPLVIVPTKRLVEVKSVTVDGKTVKIGPHDWSPDGTLWIEGLRPKGRPRRIEAEVRHGYTGAPGDILALIRSMAGRATAPGQAYTVGRINVGAPGAITPQSTEWRIIDQIRLGPIP